MYDPWISEAVKSSTYSYITHYFTYSLFLGGVKGKTYKAAVMCTNNEWIYI